MFSCYTGLIYNDFFSKSLNVFGSSWNFHRDVSTLQESKGVELDPSRDFKGNPYLFGVDPVWQASENKIVFLNSFKMKISVIFGVLHMFFGIFLNLGNHVYLNQGFNIYTELVPQIIYFSALFLYLAYLIFVKWLKYGPFNKAETGTHCAPNILVTFINMMLFKNVPVFAECSQMYQNQNQVQRILVITALICVPWLFAAKTTVLLHKKKSEVGKESSESDMTKNDSKNREESETPGEIVINQGVRTIEFVLGEFQKIKKKKNLKSFKITAKRISIESRRFENFFFFF